MVFPLWGLSGYHGWVPNLPAAKTSNKSSILHQQATWQQVNYTESLSIVIRIGSCSHWNRHLFWICILSSLTKMTPANLSGLNTIVDPMQRWFGPKNNKRFMSGNSLFSWCTLLLSGRLADRIVEYAVEGSVQEICEAGG